MGERVFKTLGTIFSQMYPYSLYVFKHLYRWIEFEKLPYGGVAGLCAVPVFDGIFVAGGQIQVRK